LPGTAPPPRTQPAAVPAQKYAPGEPPRVPPLVQPGPVDNRTYMTQPASQHPYASTYVQPSPSTASYSTPQSNASDYAGSYPSHNKADQYSPPEVYDSHDKKYPNQQQVYNGYTGQDSEAAAYPYRVSSVDALYDQTNGRGYAHPRSPVPTHKTGSSSSHFRDVDQGAPHYPSQGQIYNEVDPPNSVHSGIPYQIPPPINSGDEFHIDIGSLLRSNSTSSSLASAGSLLQEPKHSPTVDKNTPTPTSTRQLASYGSSTTAPQTSVSYSSQNFYSPRSVYDTAAMFSTPAEAPAGSSRRTRGQEYERITSLKGPLELHEDDEEEDEELEEDRFVNLSLLSHLANRLRDRVPRGTHVKGSIPYPMAFTGKDIVVRRCRVGITESEHIPIVVDHSSPSAEGIPKQHGFSNQR